MARSDCETVSSPEPETKDKVHSNERRVFDSISHAVFSIIMVFLTFFPPGLMKSFLTMRTGNAWVHVWAFHAISPHVTVDTRLIVRDFQIR